MIEAIGLTLGLLIFLWIVVGTEKLHEHAGRELDRMTEEGYPYDEFGNKHPLYEEEK